MRKIVILLILLSLAGCSVKGNIPKFPDAPRQLTEDCKELVLINDKEEKLSEVLKVVTANYSLYHECRIKVQLWNEWYNKQKEIYGELDDINR